MPAFFSSFGVLEWTLVIVAALLVCYSVYLAIDQRGSLRFVVPREPVNAVVAAAVAVLGIGYFVVRGAQPDDFSACCVLVAVGASLALVRSGMGPHGIYQGGMRVGWDRIAQVESVAVAGGVSVRYTMRGAERELVLPGADAGAVEAFLADMRKIH